MTLNNGTRRNARYLRQPPNMSAMKKRNAIMHGSAPNYPLAVNWGQNKLPVQWNRNGRKLSSYEPVKKMWKQLNKRAASSSPPRPFRNPTPWRP